MMKRREEGEKEKNDGQNDIKGKVGRAGMNDEGSVHGWQMLFAEEKARGVGVYDNLNFTRSIISPVLNSNCVHRSNPRRHNNRRPHTSVYR